MQRFASQVNNPVAKELSDKVLASAMKASNQYDRAICMMYDLKSLMLTKDFFKKIVVRLDIPHNYYDDNGIFHCNLIDFLLGKIELF